MNQNDWPRIIHDPFAIRDMKEKKIHSKGPALIAPPSRLPRCPQTPRNGFSPFLLSHALRPLKKDRYTRRCTTDPEASSFSIASAHRSACSRSFPSSPFRRRSNPCLSSAIPLAYSRPRRGFIASSCGILCLIIIDKSVRLSWPPLSSLIRHLDHRGRMRVPCYKD